MNVHLILGIIIDELIPIVSIKKKKQLIMIYVYYINKLSLQYNIIYYYINK